MDGTLGRLEQVVGAGLFAAVLLDVADVSFWGALVIVPVMLFLFGILVERLLVRWLLALDPLYNFLLTFGLTILIVDLVKERYGVSGAQILLRAGERKLIGGQEDQLIDIALELQRENAP